jgi:hypothetical protein
MTDIDTRLTARAFTSRSSVLAAAALLAIGVVLPIAIGAMSGSLAVPRNDDPAYRRIALDLYSTGRLAFNGWSQMTLVGQIALVQPFLWLSGGSAWAFTAYAAMLAGAGIVAGYALARRVLSVPRATLAVLGVLLFPGFLLNTTSYMTDVPAWSTEAICLWLGAVALSSTGRKQWTWLIAALAVGCFGFSIREFAIAAPVAVLAAHAATPLWRRRAFWASTALVVVVSAAVYMIKDLVPGGRSITEPDLTSISTGAFKESIATLGLMLTPMLFLTVKSWWRSWRAIDLGLGFAVGLFVYRTPLVEIARHHSIPRIVLGNLIEPNGALGSVVLAGTRPVLFADHTWALLNAWALAAGLLVFAIGGVVVGHALRRARPLLGDQEARVAAWRALGSVPGLMVLFTILYAGGICAWSFVYPTYDRYLWPVIIPLYLLLLRPREAAVGSIATSRKIVVRASTAVGTVLMAVLASTSLVLLLNADAFDAARWRAGESAVAGGANASTVDAGFEWVTFHATGLSVRARPPALGGVYEGRWPSFHLCTLVSDSPISSPAATLETADSNAYKLFLLGGPTEPLYVYSVAGPGCP